MFTQNLKRFEFNSVSQKTSSSTRGATRAALGPSNAAQQTTLPLVGVICRSATEKYVTVTRSLKRDNFCCHCFRSPAADQSGASFFPANFNLLLPIRQMGSSRNTSCAVLKRRFTSTEQDEAKLSCVSHHTDPRNC